MAASPDMSSAASPHAATLDLLRSRQQILDCVNLYPRIPDRFDRDAVLRVFHADAVVDFGVLVGSPFDFADYFIDLHERHHLLTAHMVYNHVCEIEGEAAHAETYFAVANNNRHGPPFTLAGGRYVDRFERRAGLWRIARRKCIAEWNANPGGDLTDKLDGLFAAVGTSARDRSDVAYERPLAIAPERIGTRIAM